MATLNRIIVDTVPYSSAANSDVELLKTQIKLEATESQSVANSTTMAQNGYNPFISTEADSPKGKIDGDAVKSKMKEGAAKMKESLGEGVKSAKVLAAKAADFTKSSIGKLDDYPVQQTQKAIDENIEKAKNEPKTMSQLVQSGLKSAGKKAAIGGLAVVSLPLAAVAIVKSKQNNAASIKAGAEQLEDELTRIDAQIQKADNEGDIDKKADLLILQRQTEKAMMKLKYGIDTRIKKGGD